MSSVSVDNRAGWGLRSALTIGLLASAGCAGEPGADEPAALCDPGRATLHRLNRSEYNNTVRDLLGDETKPALDFPAEDVAYGFDNNADILTLSPLLFEKYLEAAERLAEVAPPDDQTLRQRLFPCDVEVEGRDCARRIVADFGRRAWRRPVEDEEVDRLMSLLDVAEGEGDGLRAGINLALQAILASPHFLFRVELDADPSSPEPHLLTSREIAARLSYFLWSSTPDDMLLDAADSERLQDPEEVQAQVERMLADPKAAAFVSNFSGQWLSTRGLDHVDPEYALYPQWDVYDMEGRNLMREAMRNEANLFFTAFLEQDLDVRDILVAGFTYVDGNLASLYRIGGIGRSSTPQLVLLDGTERVGLLTLGSMLAVTSYRTRTSVVRRGKWVLTKLLCQEPPPPPPSVEALIQEFEPTTSLRAQMEQHRTDPVCASCHDTMDPIGFALEHFDAIGAWRDMDNGYPIDASGTLPDGRSFDGARELSETLAVDPTFPACLATHVLVYALGRGKTDTDACSLDAAMTRFAEGGYRLKTLISAIATSDLFRARRGEAEEAP